MLKTKGGWALEASARRRGSHRRRARIVRTLTSRRPVLAIFLVFVLIALYALAAGFVLLTSRSNLETGATDLRRAQSLLTLSAIKRSPARTIRTMEHNLSVAESHFHTADQRLALFSMVFDHLGRVPKFGSEIAGAAPAARMADQATSGTLDLVRGIKPIFGSSGAHHVPLRTLLAGIAAQKSRFRQACSSLHSAQNTRLALIGNRAATLAGPLRTFDHEIPKLVTLCQALVYAPAVLGFPHPVTYLVGYLNPHQIRATGGFLGSQALVTVHLGKVSTRFKSTAFLDRLTYLPPEPIRLDEGEPAWLFRDSNWSPDFPTSAALERFFLKLDEHQSVQGVINLTPSAAADVLRATGSFYSTDYHRMITAGNVANLADYYAHYTRNTGPLHTGSLDTQRKQFIGIVANHLFHELGALSLDQLVRLGDRLRIAVKQRDILVNLNASGPQSLVRQLGAAGAINPTTGDYLNVVDSNLSYNKINPYVHESISYRAHILPNRWLLSSVTLRYRNVPAPAYIYEDSFGPGAGKTGGPADYADFVRIYVPAGASLTSQSGWSQAWSPGPAYGKEMFSGYIIVRKGQTRTVTVRYLVPANVFSWSAGRRYRLVVQHQPGTSPDSLRIDVLGAHHRGVSRVMRHPYVDAVIGLRVPPVRLQVLQLPKVSPVVVAPGHEIEPHTVLALRRH